MILRHYDCQFDCLDGFWMCRKCGYARAMQGPQPPHRNCPQWRMSLIEAIDHLLELPEPGRDDEEIDRLCEELAALECQERRRGTKRTEGCG